MGVGAMRPERVVTNEEVLHLDRLLRPVDPGALRHHRAPLRPARGDRRRHGAARLPGRPREAGLAPGDVDAVIVSTVTWYLQTPSAAAVLAERLGCTPAAAFDLSAACAGFCHGVGLASDMVRSGSARHVLVVGVEKLSDFTDKHDRGDRVPVRRRRGRGRRRPVRDRRASARPMWGSDGAQADVISQSTAVDRHAQRGRPHHLRRLARADHGRADGVPLGRLADGARRAEGDGRRRRHRRRPRRVHPPPGQRPHHRRDGQAAPAAGRPAGRPRHRRHGQHVGGLGAAGHGADARRRLARRPAASRSSSVSAQASSTPRRWSSCPRAARRT